MTKELFPSLKVLHEDFVVVVVVRFQCVLSLSLSVAVAALLIVKERVSHRLVLLWQKLLAVGEINQEIYLSLNCVKDTLINCSISSFLP